jgi:CubicO group peptidase (beta-lactamase class C family)
MVNTHLKFGLLRAASAACVLILATAPSKVPAVATANAQAQPAVTTAAASPQHELTANDTSAWLDGYMPYALKTGDIAGAVVAIVKDGAVLIERGYGFSDVEKRAPVDPKLTLFRPGSVSKLLTWTAVMQLVEQGKIDLDVDINRYIDFKIPGLDGKPITMRNLMQHTAGFEEHAKGIISASNNLPSFETLLKQSVPERVFAPGTTPAYSNYGCSLAGYIVERVSGEPFDAYIAHHILEPLGMQHSSFRQPLPEALAPLMSKGYETASSDPKPFEFVGPAPAGSLSATADDMAHFMIAHLQDGEYHGQRIISAATAEMMHNSPLTVLPPLNRMELGFFETNINGREVIGHLGDTDWFHTSLHLFMQENAGLYISFNSPGKDGMVQVLRNQVFQDFADRYFPAAAAHPITAQVSADVQKEHAALMSGAWINSRGSHSNFLKALGLIGQVKVGVNKQGELALPFPGPNLKPRHWVEISPFVWQDVDGHDRAAARVVDGKPVLFSFDELSAFMVFYRAPWYANSTWAMPLLGASFAALLLTALLWPLAVVVRQRYRAPLTLDAGPLRAYFWSRIGAGSIVAAIVVWGVIFMLILKDTGTLGGQLDPWLWFAELFGAVAFLGGLAVMSWNLLVVWNGARRWPARVWSIVLVLAALSVAWIALVFKLIHFGSSY